MTDRPPDVVIVGAGPAGCVVAERLSRDPSRQVLLLDAGPDGPPTGPDLFAALSSPGRLWPDLVARRTPTSPARAYPRGRGVGGSAAVNGMMALPPTPADLARWHAGGLSLDGTRPGKAPYPTVAPSCWGPADRLVAVTARALGIPLLRQANDTTIDGIGPVPLHATIDPDGTVRRASTDTTDLDPARTRPNLTVRDNTQIARALINDDGRCVGVVTTTGEEIHGNTTVLAAGAIHSPALLLRSGLTRPGIGANLADHAAVGATLHFREPADPSALATSAVAHRGGLQVVALNRLGTTDSLTTMGALLVGVLHSNGRGTVTIDAAGDPVVTFDLLSDPDDQRAIVAATRLLVDLCTRPEARHETTHISGDDHGSPIETLIGADDATLLRWAEANLADYVHATGTCRYGTADDPHSVVGPGGLVHGTPGLAVIDASVFPSPPTTNPWLPTVLLADTLATQLAAMLSGSR